MSQYFDKISGLATKPRSCDKDEEEEQQHQQHIRQLVS